LIVPPTAGSSVAGVMNLNPSFGFAQQEEEIIIQGFIDTTIDANADDIIFEFDGASLTTTPANIIIDSNGSFNATFPVPNLFNGIHFIEGKVRDTTNTETGTNLFSEFTILSGGQDFVSTITPSTGLSIISGQAAGANSTFNVKISSLDKVFPGENLKVSVFGIPFGVDISFDGVSDDDGFITVTLPAGKSTKTLAIELDPSGDPYPGFYFLFIDVCTSDFLTCNFFDAELNILAPSTFGDIPSITVTPPAKKAGEEVNITLNNFKASSAVTVDFAGTSISMTTKDTGKISELVSVPTVSAGTYFVSAIDADSNNDSLLFSVLDADDKFIATVSPPTIDNLQQGSNFTAVLKLDVFAGSELDCDGSGSKVVDIKMSSLPQGITAKFGSGVLSSAPTTILNSSGGIAANSTTFEIASNTIPGFYDVFIETSCATESHETFLELSVIPDSTAVSFGGFNPYSFGSSLKMASDVVNVGNSTEISGCCWNSGDNVNVSVYTGSATNTAVSFVGTTPTFLSSGAIPPGVSITIPTLPVGFYELDVIDSSFGFGTTPFKIPPSGQTFELKIKPQFLSPVAQGSASGNVGITIKAFPKANPGATGIFIEGLPPGMTATVNGTDVTTPNTFDTITPEIGGTVTVQLVLTPSTSTPPGLYVLQVNATGGGGGAFADVIVPVEFGGSLASIASQFANLVAFPSFIQEGKIVQFIGSGYNPSSDLTAFILDSELDIGTFSSDTSGDFTFNQKVPDDTPPGVYPITVIDASGREAIAIIEVIGSDTDFVLSANPAYFPPIRQGETTPDITVKLSSPLGVDAPNTRIEVAALPPGIDLRFNDQDVDSWNLNPGVGGSETVKINLITSFDTPPGNYDVIITAEEIGGTEFSGVPVAITISPDNGGEEITSVMLVPLDIFPGQPFLMFGEGFVATSTFSTIEIKIPGDPSPTTITLPATVTVDGSGDWQMKGVIPETVSGSAIDPGHYVMSITAGADTANEKTGSIEFDIIPDDVAFFKVSVDIDRLAVDQGVALSDSLTNATMILKPSMSFTENLTLDVSDLPPGIRLNMTDSFGNELAHFNGTSTGVTQSTIPILTLNTDIFPGKLTPVELIFSASSKVPVGVYEIFVGAKGTTLDLRGVPIILDVLDSLDDPSLFVLPTFGSVLDEGIVLMGTNFANSQQLTVTFGSESVGDNQFAIDPDPTSTRADGTFALKFKIPNISPGIYPIEVLDGTNSVFTNFQIIPSTADSITMQIAPKKVLLEQGATNTGNQTITVKTFGSFTDSTTMSASGLPTGVTASFTPTTFTPTPGTSTPVKLTLTDGGTASPASTAFTVTATSSSTTISESATVQVIPIDTFTFSVGPGEIILRNDGTSNSIVKTQVTAIGSPTDPTVTVGALPTGITASSITSPLVIDSTAKIGNGTITFSADNTASVGTSSVTINAGAKSATLDITITDTAIENFDNKEFDPSSISEKIPLQLKLAFTGFEPTLTFESITTDTQSSTQILTNKFTKDPTLLAPFPPNILSGDFNILTIDVDAGVSEIEVDICLPSSTTVTDTQTLMFLNIATNLWETVSSFVSGTLICVDDVTHTSSWAVGGVKALAAGGATGGGGGSAFAPSFAGKYFESDDKHPLEINGITYDLPRYDNEVEKQIITTGDPTEFKFTLFENSGGENIQHFEFLINLTELKKYHNSDTFIIYDKKPSILWSETNKQESDYTLTINDPHGFFGNVDFNIEYPDNFEAVITLNIIFAKPMPESDIFLRIWDSEKNSRDTILINAIEIIAEEQSIITETDDKEQINAKKVLNIPEWIKTSAGWWNEGQINDETFVKGIEFLIQEQIINLPTEANVSLTPEEIEANRFDWTQNTVEKTIEIPPWIKNSAGWWAEGLLSDEEFINALKFLVEQEIIRI